MFVVWCVWAFIDDGTAFVALAGAGLAQGSVVALAAIGFLVIMKATGIANFAQGDLITLGAFPGVWATDQVGLAPDGLGLSLGAGYLLTLALMFAVGVGIERVAYAPLRGRSVHVVVIATLGVALVIRTILGLWQGTVTAFAADLVRGRQLARQLPDLPGRRAADRHRIPRSPRRGDLGATGGDHRRHRHHRGGHDAPVLPHELRSSGPRHRRRPRTARLYGVKATRLSMLSFGIASLLAGLAGLMIGPLGSFDLTLGFSYMLLGFAAAVLGGFGSLGGVALGALLIGFTEQLFGGLLLPKLVEQLGGDPANVLKYRSVFPYVLMLVVIAISPQGLFGKTGRRL